MPRVDTQSGAFNDRPFDGEGVSVYASIGSTVRYRNLRVLPAGRTRGRRHGTVKGQGGNHNLAASSVLKTARVASAASPAATLDYTLPAAMLNQTVTFDVRRYLDDVENESDNYRTATVETDGGGDDATGILGTATLLSQEVRSGGIVRLRIAYKEARSGVQPTVFRAIRTAGPSSPASATASYRTGQRLVEIDTPALLDSSAYTFKVRAENALGTVTLDVLTGISVTADATGPAAPSSGSVEVI